MVSRFAQIVNAFLRRTFGEQPFPRCRRHDRHDTRDETDASCIFRILRNTNPVSRETYLPKNRILLYTHKLSDVSRIVASRSRAHGGRRKDKKYCRRSSVEEDVRETRFAKRRRTSPSRRRRQTSCPIITLVNELPSASKCLLNQTSPGWTYKCV